MSSYFYSGQTRRFIQQFIRLLNNFEIQLGRDRAGNRTLLRVPIYYGDSSRQVAAILARNTENNLPSVPAMSVYISELNYDRTRVQEPQHVSKMQIRQRAYNPDTGEFTQYQGDLVTVERLMPVPYLLKLKVDIWTSNTDQKLQIFEQMAVLFNPSLELQSTDSYVDWTSLTTVTLLGNQWSSRSVPMGPEDTIDVVTLNFEMPIWYSAPAKVRKMGVIQKILANVYDADGENMDQSDFDIAGSIFVTRRVYTPIDLNVVYSGNTLKLYASESDIQFTDGVTPAMQPSNWRLAIQSFGEISGVPGGADILVNGLSQITLSHDGINIVGTVAYHPTDESLLIFNLDTDTLPTNTLSPVTAIIDPYHVTVTSSLLTPAAGTRYLILNPIGDPDNNDGDPATLDGAPVWNRMGQPQLIANANDIIQFNGNAWTVAFDSVSVTSIQYVTNLNTGAQYKWKDQQWSKSVEGRYGVGAWSFVPNN